MLSHQAIIDEFFKRLKSVICKKYTNTDCKDREYTNSTDISIIWLYWRLCCRLYCRLYWRLFCRLYCRLLFVMQYFFFLFFHKCSKVMTLGDTSRMFLSCYCLFSLLLSFLFNTKSTRMFRYFLSQNRLGLLIRGHLYSTSVVIFTLNGGMDDTHYVTNLP